MSANENRISTDFRRALRGFAATVSIVSARDRAGNHGITVTAVSSVSMDPPSLLVVVNRSGGMHAALAEGERFCINILGTEQVEHSRLFGKSMPMGERFEHGDWRLSADDVPYLNEAQANIFCRRVSQLDVGTHTVFVGTVYRLAIGDAISPLIYLNGEYLGLDDEAGAGLVTASPPAAAAVRSSTSHPSLHHAHRRI
ncbi:flavin reductase family protein [Pigmentiphaga sp.]|uniref:flavin reductase family protein n=1 Tax=Pigmentiphaga sp. TaxID=1977564 RepID=UPI0025FD4988|nr:flavin reductase family protein [Pigmentiphaga sp.]